MADTRLTKVSFMRAIYLCMLAIFNPKKLIEEERKYEEKLKILSPSSEQRESVICRAFWYSLFMVIVSAVIGYIIGIAVNRCLSSIPKIIITIFQVVGAAILLWGTLFVRGWEIQTIDGVTLYEKINRWIYIALYCLGTAIIVCSLILKP